jgi:thiol-disulfide isomerase/thioredoxin
MVYGAWCGHSKRALPAFQELVKMTDVTTSSGQPIEFVLTEDTNKALVKEMQVRGFPTYKYVLPDGTVKPFNAGNRSKEAILESAKKL